MLGLLLAALFIALNAFFVAAEFALVKVRATQLEPRVRRGEKSAVVAKEVIARLDRYLSVSQFGITVASLGLGWIGEPTVSVFLDGIAVRILGRPLEQAGHVVVDVIALALLTYGHLLLGELVPKFVAIQKAEATALYTAIPLRLVYLAFRPVLWVLEWSQNAVLRLIGLRPGVGEGESISEEEAIGLITSKSARSPLGRAKTQILERVLRFAPRTVRSSMVPRVDVVSLPITTSGAETRAHLRAAQFSRIPLTRGRSLDEVLGYLYVKDFLFHLEPESLPDLSSLRRDVLFIPGSSTGLRALREMQRAHVPFAVVVDEYGGTSGIVTMEDLVEEIVGEIQDELDEEPQKIVRAKDDDAWDVDGSAVMDDLRSLGIPVDDAMLGKRVGVVVAGQLEHIPHPGDKVELAPGATAEVTGISKRRVKSVRIRVAKEAPA